ncbi:hypothetical protein [Lacticaseibacillus absianus]|uniref:hypothetical protein n=1 Tax=Lacticaseibacillus absianus TaxID=2729623 RepID=UPI0015CA7E23|nr:hypothetical protein [Lacticaseibacillus absianus]
MKKSGWWLSSLALGSLLVAGLGRYLTTRGGQATDAAPSAAAFENGMKDHQFGQRLFLDAKTKGFDSAEALAQAAQSIVIATKTDQHQPTVSYDRDDLIEYAYTRSDFVVDRVIRSSQLHAGETFAVLENEAYNARQKVTYHIAGYTLMDQGARYLLFLNYSDSDGWYIPLGTNTGKVNLDNNGTRYADKVIQAVRDAPTGGSQGKAGVREALLTNAQRDTQIHAAARAKYARQIAADQ